MKNIYILKNRQNLKYKFLINEIYLFDFFKENVLLINIHEYIKSNFSLKITIL